MTTATLFFIFLGLLVLGMLIAIANFAKGFNTDIEEINIRNVFFIHLLCMLLTFVGGLGSLICGIIWIVNVFKPS